MEIIYSIVSLEILAAFSPCRNLDSGAKKGHSLGVFEKNFGKFFYGKLFAFEWYSSAE